MNHKITFRIVSTLLSRKLGESVLVTNPLVVKNRTRPSTGHDHGSRVRTPETTLRSQSLFFSMYLLVIRECCSGSESDRLNSLFLDPWSWCRVNWSTRGRFEYWPVGTLANNQGWRAGAAGAARAGDFWVLAFWLRSRSMILKTGSGSTVWSGSWLF